MMEKKKKKMKFKVAQKHNQCNYYVQENYLVRIDNLIKFPLNFLSFEVNHLKVGPSSVLIL